MKINAAAVLSIAATTQMILAVAGKSSPDWLKALSAAAAFVTLVDLSRRVVIVEPPPEVEILPGEDNAS